MRFLIILLLLFLSLSLSQIKAESITISAAHWVGYTEPKEKGIYVDLLKVIYADETIHFDIGSFARAKRRFSEQKTDILVGIYKEDLAYLRNAILPVHHIDMEYPVLAIYDPKIHKIDKLSDLNGLIVAWYQEYRYDRFFPSQAIRYPFDDLNSAMRLLEAGRIDVVIDHIYNLHERDKKLFRTFQIAPELPLWLAFQNTDKGRQLMKMFDDKMVKLRKSGQLEKLFGQESNRANFDRIYKK